MKWRREEYLELMTFGQASRPMFCELFGTLVGLPEEWRAQGASEDEISLVAFDWDYVPSAWAGGQCGPITGLTARVLEDNEECQVSIDHYGRKAKLCKKSATIPLPLSHPVESEADWIKVRKWYEFAPERIDWNRVEVARKAREDGALTVIGIPGGFDEPRQLMGEENTCLCYYENPGMMQDMLDTIGATAAKVLERICEKLPIDQLSVHEDMAGKSGPLAGPSQVREFIAPYYRRCWEVVKAAGGRVFHLDSDGNMNPILEELMAGGINCALPLEPAAGMDSVAVRKKFGSRLAMAGGIDKHVLRQGKKEIRAELEYKMQPLMRQGGMLFGLDHRIPNGTPLENYRYYVDTGREILGLPAREKGKVGWARMAL